MVLANDKYGFIIIKLFIGCKQGGVISIHLDNIFSSIKNKKKENILF